MKGLRSVIASISTAFTANYRATFLLLISIILIGGFSYTTLLKRDGYPSVQFPIGIVQTGYFVDDAEKVDEDVTRPLEAAIANIPQVNSISSNSRDNFSVIFVEFDTTVTSEGGMKLVNDEIKSEVELPEAANVEAKPINAATLDGEHDLIFTISSDKSIKEMQQKAAELVEKIDELSQVKDVEVVEQITPQINPETGEEFDFQEDFNRYGEKENGTIVFKPAVAIGVNKKASVSSVQISEAVREEVDSFKDDGKLTGYTVSYGGDLAGDIDLSISSLENNALWGMIAVVIILFLFVSWRGSIVTLVFFPAVLAASFAGLFLIGYTLNVITLFALILVLGLLVDDAIVVLEAIDYQKKNGRKGLDAVREAISNIAIADISGTMTTVLVFIPIAMISGVLGEFIRPIPVTVILTLVLSLVIALTLIPLIASILFKEGKLPKFSERKPLDKVLNAAEHFIFIVGKKVSKFVNSYLSNVFTAGIVLVVSIAAIGIGFVFGGKLEFNIFPNPKDANDIGINITYKSGTELEKAEKIAIDVEEILIDTAKEHVVSVDYYFADTETALINVNLTDLNDRDITAVEISEMLNQKYENYPEAKVEAGLVSVGPPAGEYQYAMQVYGDDTSALRIASNDIADFIKMQDLSNPEVEILDVKVENLDNIAKIDGRRYAQVSAKLSEEAVTGDIVELRDLIEVEYTNDKLDRLGLDEDGLGFDLGQESENLESFNSAMFAMMVAMVVMYVMLVVQFNSFSQPLLVFLAIPFSLPGVLPGLVLTNNPFSFFVVIGMTGLIGIVVNNTIMLLDYANQQREAGKSPQESIVEAIKVRFRPLVTTSVTTIAGLLPLAFSDPFWEALAFTIVFGLAASTTLVILTFPVYYVMLEKVRNVKSRLLRSVLG